MAEATPVFSRKQSARFAATLNSPPLTWILHSVALRKGMMPGSRRWIRAPRDRKSRAPSLRIFSPVLMFVLNRVGSRRYVAALAGPVGVEELAAGLIGPLVGVGAEVV